MTIRENKDLLGSCYIPTIPLLQGGGVLLRDYCMGFGNPTCRTLDTDFLLIVTGDCCGVGVQGHHDGRQGFVKLRVSGRGKPTFSH